MAMRAELHPDFSDPDAAATPWAEAVAALEGAEIFWVSTARPDGRPHVTPLCAVWLVEAVYFCTGHEEQKARNLQRNPRCVLTTGSNSFREGLDVIVEGEAKLMQDEALLRRLAERWIEKFDWRYDVYDGAFHHENGQPVDMYEVRPVKMFAYARGGTYSQTRYRP